MYTSFYNLKSKPFQISSDPSFIWLGEKHREALATLRYGVLDNKGFLLLTGDVGTGKTTLINTLIASLENDVIYASVPDPRLDTLDFFNYIASSFGIAGEFDTKGKFLITFSKFLHEAYERNKKVLLIIDESQLLTQESLEEIRLLSNIVTPNSHLLNIFFVGQNEFHDIISRPENRAVAQRLTLNYYIEPLSLEETGKYIRHRLEVAGTKEELFDANAIREIHICSGGFPRRINIICDHCLLTGYVKEEKTIDDSIVRDCSLELEISEFKRKGPHNMRPERLEQPVLTPPVYAEQVVFKPVAKTRRSRPFKVLGTCLLIVFALVIFSLVFPDFFTKTYSEAMDYLSLTKNQLGMIATPQSSEELRTEAQGRSGSFDNQQYKSPSPVPPPPSLAKESRSAEIKIQTARVVSGKPKAQNPENPEELAIRVKQGAESLLFETTGTSSVALPKNNLTEAGPKNADHRDNAPQTVTLPLPEESLIIRFVQNSNFFNGQDISELHKFAKIVKTYPEAVVQITGYTDSSGSKRYNAKLSEFRAEIVKSFLLGQGLSGKQIKAQGLGIQNPIARNDTPEGRRLNRRVEIKVVSR